MFARVKKSGNHQYLQIVENRKEKGKVKQRVVATVGRMDRLQEKGRVETLIRSLSRFSEQTMLILSGKSDLAADAKKIGPVLIFERLWKETGIQAAIVRSLKGRRFEFNVERAIFLTVLHRLMVSGSDRFCHRWCRDYIIDGIDDLDLHHLYRAMGFLGEQIEDQDGATPFSPRCNKDLIEESIFSHRRDLFTHLDLVFFDTTSIYFEGRGGESIGQRGFSKDHRPDLPQMVVGAILDDKGQPICCEMWPGNTADVKTLLPIVKRLKTRFKIGRICIVADRGMISANTIKQLESKDSPIPYILGARMRKVKEIRDRVLSQPGRYKQVRPESYDRNKPAPLKVKQVEIDGNRYIVCVNTRQQRKDAADREAIVSALTKQLKKGPKSLVGNKGYRKYLKLEKNSACIDKDRIKYEARFDGKWVLRTNTDLPADQVALKYKELWQVEKVFRDVKSLLTTRPIFHQKDSTIRGHVFCSFLALVLRKELDRRLLKKGHRFEWAEIKQDLKALQRVTIEEDGWRLSIRSRSQGVCGKVFQCVGVALPATIQEA
ncbi:IS1634 family transposase [Desulfosarcina ovata]|uniref:Transposase n=1 Tax=Desulfosarcina ovata subsp. ovata TaxID=2752305 RepID=A0A5K8A7D0_9BACT|nr:IS1634 family transposase [Desulfosarcina ovata]BBO88050.1 transposase [Desulfosarcina ovata subsp. ovata]